jgi:hypothetical protein
VADGFAVALRHLDSILMDPFIKIKKSRRVDAARRLDP